MKRPITKDEFIKLLPRFCIHPHPETRCGKIHMDRAMFNDDGTVNVVWNCIQGLDLTGDLFIGPYTMLGAGTMIFTHDHHHSGTEPLLVRQDREGVKWQNKTIGRDVWIHGATILYQVTEIPDGVVVGAGAVLTRNPGPYEIWAGNPAKKIGVRN